MTSFAVTQDGLVEDVEVVIEHGECIQGAVIDTRIDESMRFSCNGNIDDGYAFMHQHS